MPHPRTLSEWLAYQQRLHRRRIELGLDRIGRVFRRLLPDDTPPLTLTIGGTNGKGSVVAYLEAILLAAGYRVGAYTSPHLLRYNERIRIGGLPVEDGELCEAFARVEEARGEEPLSFFEFGTLTAFDLFWRSGVQVQLLEVGLGGRLDAVNLLDADAAAIVTIDLDHREWLGETREEIALEKAGILRPGRIAVIGDPDPPATLLAYLKERAIPATFWQRDFFGRRQREGWRWWNRRERLDQLPRPPLPGSHQLQNASVALELLSRLRERLPVSEEAIREGLARTRLPGRCHWIRGRPDQLLDVAHNPQAARQLAAHLREEAQGRRIVALFSCLKDKEIEGIIAPLLPLVDLWVVAPLESERAAPLAALTEPLQRAGAPFLALPSLEEAYRAALTRCRPDDLLLVFGSFLTVGTVLSWL